MATIQAIFAQLGADASFLSQFVIVLLMFIILKFVFFSKLQFVIENREDKTIKLENSAEEIFEKVNKLTKEYSEKIETAKFNLQKQFVNETDMITKENTSVIKKQEEEVEKYVEISRAEIKQDVANKEQEVLKQTDELTNKLIEKLTK